MSYLPIEVFTKVTNALMNLEEDKRFLCIRLLYYVGKFLPIRECGGELRFLRFDETLTVLSIVNLRCKCYNQAHVR